MPLHKRTGALAALMLAMTVPSGHAADVKVGDLTIEHPWARATPSGAAVGGGYMTIRNRGAAPDHLVGGSFEASTGFELHTMSMDGGVMIMRPIGPLEIPAGGAVTLDPSGRHVMLTGLKRGLKQGQQVAGTLIFDHAGTVPVTFTVEGIGAKAPTSPAKSMPGMDMD